MRGNPCCNPRNPIKGCQPGDDPKLFESQQKTRQPIAKGLALEPPWPPRLPRVAMVKSKHALNNITDLFWIGIVIEPACFYSPAKAQESTENIKTKQSR